MPPATDFDPARFSNYRDAKRAMAACFQAAELDFAKEDAEDLLLGLAGLSRADYVLHSHDPLPPKLGDKLRDAVTRRFSGEPVDRILGWREFYGRRFDISNVLSPRGDTEVLLLAALDAMKHMERPSLLDLGTGSGALAISLLCERTDATAVAIDSQPDALLTARANAETHGVSTRIEFYESDWFDTLPPRRFDIIVSNPPYIDSPAMKQLSSEVARFDPKTALHGGSDGLDAYRIIVPDAQDRLKPGGWLGVEIGFDQGDAVRALFDKAGYSNIRLRRDPSGHDRVVEGRKPQ